MRFTEPLLYQLQIIRGKKKNHGRYELPMIFRKANFLAFKIPVPRKGK